VSPGDTFAGSRFASSPAGNSPFLSAPPAAGCDARIRFAVILEVKHHSLRALVICVLESAGRESIFRRRER
jgi:hypothetical protein